MFTGQVRVRVNGILIRDSRMLLVEINSPTRNEPFWMPPGGGVQFRESLETALKREVEEETGLMIEADKLLYISEYLKDDWHAVEFYYLCKIYGGEPKLGHDPELDEKAQLLSDLQWVGRDEISGMNVFPQFIKDDFDRLITGDLLPIRYMRQ